MDANKSFKEMDETWDPSLGGSIKHDIVNPDLVKERQKLAFDKDELELFLIGPEIKEKTYKIAKIYWENPEVQGSFDYYEMTREEQMERWWKRYYDLKRIAPEIFLDNSKSVGGVFTWSYMF